MTNPSQLPTYPGPDDMVEDERLPQPSLYGRPQAESVDYAGDVDQRIRDAARSVHRKPSKAQRDAGNFTLGHVYVQGLDVAIEVPRGRFRCGIAKNGKHWSRKMKHHYGYLRRTKSADDECVDVWLGPNPRSELVFVVDQVDPETGKFDEHKVMLGFLSENDARHAYLDNYPRSWAGMERITALTMAAFKKWLVQGNTRRRISRQISEQYRRRGGLVGYADVTGGEIAEPKPPKSEKPANAATPAADIPAPVAPPPPKQSLKGLLSQSQPHQVGKLLTHDHDWGTASQADHADVRAHLSSMPPAALIGVAHHVAQSQGSAPHAEASRRAVVHALMHAEAGPVHPLSSQTLPYAHFVQAVDPQQQAHVDAVLHSFPKLENGGVLLPHGLDVQALLGEQIPVQAIPYAVAKKQMEQQTTQTPATPSAQPQQWASANQPGQQSAPQPTMAAGQADALKYYLKKKGLDEQVSLIALAADPDSQFAQQVLQETGFDQSELLAALAHMRRGAGSPPAQQSPTNGDIITAELWKPQSVEDGLNALRQHNVPQTTIDSLRTAMTDPRFGSGSDYLENYLGSLRHWGVKPEMVDALRQLAASPQATAPQPVAAPRGWGSAEAGTGGYAAPAQQTTGRPWTVSVELMDGTLQNVTVGADNENSATDAVLQQLANSGQRVGNILSASQYVAPMPDEPWQGGHKEFMDNWGGEPQRQGGVQVHATGSAAHLFGRDLRPHEFAALANAAGGAGVQMGADASGLYLHASGEGISTRRTITRDYDGNLVCNNGYFRLDDDSPHKGGGYTFTARQVAQLKKLGVSRIETSACGSKQESLNGGLNGYITWPKLGFSGRIENWWFSRLPANIQAAMGNSREIRDLMDMPGGEEAWEEHGGSIECTFDLSDGSRNMKALENYIARRQQKDRMRQGTNYQAEATMSRYSEPTEEQINQVVEAQRRLRAIKDINSPEYRQAMTELENITRQTGLGEGVGVDA